MDDFIRDLIALLTRRKLLQNTVLVVGDHGEHFAIDGTSNFGHGSTINENDTHVPLIVRTPALSTSTKSVRDQVKLRAQESVVMSLTSVPAMVADALGSRISHRVHKGSYKDASLILDDQHDKVLQW